MKNNLLPISIANQIILILLPIKDFFMKSIYNNKFMEYLIKWVAVAGYVCAYFLCIISIYFFSIALINKINEEKIKSSQKNKTGIVLWLISFTATVVTAGLIIIFG